MEYPSSRVLLSIGIPQSMKTLATPAAIATPKHPQSVTAIEISDPTLLGETVEAIKQKAVQLGSMSLRGRQVVVRPGSRWLVRNAPIRARFAHLRGECLKHETRWRSEVNSNFRATS
jgi:hypothetical protein